MKRSPPKFLEPVSLENFFSTYWEKQPLHIARADNPLATEFNIAAIENLLSTMPVFYPGVQLTQSGKSIAVSEYADDQNQILPLRLFELHLNGATIVISQAQKLFPVLSALCKDTMRGLQMRCQANLYLSPPGNQGFNAHYDSHDVFILQISGAKSFNFYPSSIDLPFPGEAFDPTRLSGAPIDESIPLTAGDTLYIPRGVVHDAIADEHATSLHITVGVFPVLMRDMLREAVQMMSQSERDFRQSVDSYLAQPTLSDSSHALPSIAPGLAQTRNTSDDTLTLQLAQLMGQVASQIQSTDFVKKLHARFLDELAVESHQDCFGLSRRLLQIADPGETTPYSRLKLRDNMLLGFEIEDEVIKIRTFGQVLEFREPVSGVVSQLLLNGVLESEVLSSLNEEQSSALVKRLLHENLVDLS